MYNCYLLPTIKVAPSSFKISVRLIAVLCSTDTMVRQAAMVVKCVLLMYYKNSKGRHYRRQVICSPYYHSDNYVLLKCVDREMYT
jgi:hypothetical protein